MAAVAFDYADVLPTVRAAAKGATREEAEDAIQTAVMEHLDKGVPLTAANVVQRARSRLLNARQRRDNRNASLDALREDTEDSAPVELAVAEVDFDSHAELAEARRNPILAAKLARAERGGAAELRRSGTASPSLRYDDETVARARALRSQGKTWREVAEAVGVRQATVERWGQPGRRPAVAETGWSFERIVEAVKAVWREDGKPPSYGQCNRDPRLPESRTIRKHCGSWTAVADAAGFEPQKAFTKRWTDDAVEAGILGFERREGRLPVWRDFKADPNLPPLAKLHILYGTARAAAVLEIIRERRGG